MLLYIFFFQFFKKMMKMNLSIKSNKMRPAPIIRPITVQIKPYQHTENSQYPFSSLIDRIKPTGNCSSCGGK